MSDGDTTSNSLRTAVFSTLLGKPHQSTVVSDNLPVNNTAKINLPHKRLFLKSILCVFSLLFFSYAASGLYQSQFSQIPTQTTTAQVEAQNQVLGVETPYSKDQPLRLKIPSLNVDATIEAVNLTPQGAMAVPQSTANVGWFNLGPYPGERGSAVIAGHLNAENGEPAVFTNLSKLKAGDKILVENDNGRLLTFIVSHTQIYNPGYADDVFSLNTGSHLNLVTCNGIWDEDKKSYSKRLIVFTDLAQEN